MQLPDLSMYAFICRIFFLLTPVGYIMRIQTDNLKDNYANVLSKALLPARRPKYVALDIYSDAGGLSLGLEAAGL